MISKIIYIDHNNYEYLVPHDSIVISSYKEGKASSIIVNCVSSDFYADEGQTVVCYIDDIAVFTGRIMNYTKTQDSVCFTAYDNLYYLKGKDVLSFSSKKASQIIYEICTKLDIKTSDFAITDYVLPTNRFSNTSYFEMITSVLYDSFLMSGKKYILFDDCGYLKLNEITKNANIITINTEFILFMNKYLSATDIYNYIKVYQEDTAGNTLSYVSKNDSSINKIGQAIKILKVDRNLTSAQCKIIADNLLFENQNRELYYELVLIATDIIKINDVILIDDIYYEIKEIKLEISSIKDTYTLKLEVM